MRKVYPVDNDWRFNSQKVDIPHTLRRIPVNYFSNADVTTSGVYERSITLSEQDITGSTILLRFYGVGSSARVFCNEKLVKENFCAYNTFECDITSGFASRLQEFDSFSSVNIRVEVSAAEDPLIPPYGSNIDYLVFGGIYRPVEVLILPKDNWIRDFHAFGTADGRIHLDAVFSGLEKPSITILDMEHRKIAEASPSMMEMENGFQMEVQDPGLWDIHHGRLYTAILNFGQDSLSVRFGFRTTEFRPDGFYINGRKEKLIGLDRHQSFPINGYAMPASMQSLDADLVFRTGLNIVRTSHYMQDSAFLDRCDEVGILVFEEIPGWQYVSQDQRWRDLTVENVRSMINRDKSHPSIILWGVRINESPDDDELYTRTNGLAHQLDPLRQTGGVRYITRSHLLEDVYTFNDFIHRGDNIGLRDPSEVHKENCPHLVTEYCGHMFSTKPYDDEAHRLQHALRHARVVDAMYGNPKIAGCIGWCLFDYNTHDNFGSGDMVCYHGVCDADRIPKLAWYLYASQSSLDHVLGISSFMDDGDNPANISAEVAVFTNADSVKVHLNEEYLGEYFPARDLYPNLPHPPVIIRHFLTRRLAAIGITRKEDADVIAQVIKAVRQDPSPAAYKPYALKLAGIIHRSGLKRDEFISKVFQLQNLAPTRKGVWRFEGIKDGQTVSTQVIDPDAPVTLQVTPSETEFHLKECNTFQVAQIQLVCVREGCSMRLPYFFDSLQVHAEGSIALYGTEPLVTIVGGAGAVYIRTQEPGKGWLDIHSQRFGDQRIEFTVEN